MTRTNPQNEDEIVSEESVLLDQIAQKVDAAERLSAAEAEFLFQPGVDVHEVGRLADRARRRRLGNVAYYNVNAHLNPTNVCIYRCRLCAYSRDADDADAYVMPDEDVVARAREAAAAGATELHVVGGLHPDKGFDWYLGLVRLLHDACPEVHIKAFTAVEIARFAELARQPVGKVLEQLIEAGLGSLPGGGAEILDPHVRAEICPHKADGRAWLDVHRTAHRLGLRSNATMLYGHVETLEQRVDHLLQLRRLQDETGGFQAFVPLCFHPEGTRLAHLAKTSPVDDLRTVAVSRLFLDNFDHVKAYWITLGIGIAQTALAYGADDLDGTVRYEEIHHRAGSDSPEALSVAQLRRLIGEAGFQPVERDTLYRRVER
ncbi:MAG: aminofutalosine synthase MqnE [Pirellulales bacterium]|nr:aminofutalosine synthase MqnE [Pirellulales bacterium]